MRLFFVLVFGLIGICSPVQAQELNCQVTVNFQSLSGSEFTFLRELEEQVELYLNEHSWTEDAFEDEERIDCLFQIVMEEAVTLTSFSARAVLSSRRPIYGVPQVSTVLQISDSGWQFNYAQGTPIVHDLERPDPLASVLDFYAYIMIGYDYDSFNEFGGTPHFEMARRIAERAAGQNTGIGWEDLGDNRGRSDLINQVLDPRFKSLRKAYFDYHFGGLDLFVEEPEIARENTLAAVTGLEDLYDEVSRQYVLDLFFSSKAEELAAIFMDSPLSSQAYELLSRLDPANTGKYEKLVN